MKNNPSLSLRSFFKGSSFKRSKTAERAFSFANAFPIAAVTCALSFTLGCPTATGDDPAPSDDPVVDVDAGDLFLDAGVVTADGGRSNDGGIEVDPCEDIELGADGLGSLVLNASYSVVETATAPAGLSRTAFASNGANGFVGVGIENTSALDLGTWPVVEKGNVLFEVIDPVDVNETSFLSPYLSATEGHVAAGYTMIGDGFPGKVALYNRNNTTVQYLNAPGNYTAALDDTHLYVDALGANAEVGSGVFAFNIQDDTTQLAVTFSAVDFGGNGYCLVTDDVLLAGYADTSFSNHTPAIGLSAALGAADIGAALDAATFDSAFSGSIVDAARFGNAGAFLVGTYDANFNLILQSIQAVSLTVEMNGVSVGEEVELLTFDDDACTTVDYITPLGDDLVLQTRAGDDVRLVRIQVGQ